MAKTLFHITRWLGYKRGGRFGATAKVLVLGEPSDGLHDVRILVVKQSSLTHFIILATKPVLTPKHHGEITNT